MLCERLAPEPALRAGTGPDSFWTWREVMYRFLDRLSPDDVEAIAAQLGRRAGIACDADEVLVTTGSLQVLDLANAVFVAPGDTVHLGQTVGLLEVMKTFNRLVYEGDGLPDTVRIVAVVPSDGDDVTRGEPILRLDSVLEG